MVKFYPHAFVLVGALVVSACRGDLPPPPPVQKVPPMPNLSTLREPPKQAKQEEVELLPLSSLPPVPPMPDFVDGAHAPALSAVETPEFDNYETKQALEPTPLTSLSLSVPASENPLAPIEIEVPQSAGTPKPKALVGTEPTQERMARLEAALLENQPDAVQDGTTLLTPRSTVDVSSAQPKTRPAAEQGGEIIAISEDPTDKVPAPTESLRELRTIRDIELVAPPAPRTAPAPELDMPLAAPKAMVPPVVEAPKKQQAQDRPLLQAEPMVNPYGDEGVVMAQTRVEEAFPTMRLDENSVPDCGGQGITVAVESTTGQKMDLLDAEGRPCGEAQVMFDGTSPAGQRQAAPGIDITVYEGTPVDLQKQPASIFVSSSTVVMPQGVEDYAAVPANKLPRIIKADVVTEGGIKAPGNLSQEDLAAIEQLAAKATEAELTRQGRLEATIQTWQSQNGAAPSNSERALADALQEDLQDIRQQAASKLAENYERQMETLAQQLRQAEVERDLLRSRHEQVSERLNKGQMRTEVERNQWRQEERSLREDLEALNQRMAELTARNARLKDTFGQREQAYLEKIARLQRDLAAAEEKANKARQEMILEAAQKIAEAERLAYAARMAEKDRLERKAARLQLEGSTLMDRAQKLDEGQTVLVPGLSQEFVDQFPPVQQVEPAAQAADAAPLPPFTDLPVQIAVRDVPLKSVMEQVFGDLAGAIGPWEISWELNGANIGIKEDQWTVRAETTLGEFLDYVSNRVSEVHGVKLNFERFDKNRIFVISDTQ